MMFAAAAVAVLVIMVLAVARGFLGPTVYDRILAVNTFGTMAVILIAVMGFLTERPEFLDIALLYALLNFIGTVAVTRFVRFQHLGGPIGDDDPGDI
jgi:multicomponent Na+:H+ antiporter subunit F